MLLNVAVFLQTHHMYSTLKQVGNGRFHVIPTWDTRGVFVGMLETSKAFSA